MSSIYVPDRYAQATPYYRMVYARMAEIDPEFPSHDRRKVHYITSNDVPLRGVQGGVTFEAHLQAAAEAIVNGSHRLSTPEEIARYHQDKTHREQVLHEHNQSKKNTMVIKSSPEDDARMAGLIASAVQATLAASAPKTSKGA